MTLTCGRFNKACSLRELARVLHPSAARARWLLVLKLCGDIGGKPTDAAMAAACYIGTERQWDGAEKDWERALQDAKINYFHATDFFSCHGEFRDWKCGSKRHIATGRRFAAIAQGHDLMGIAVGLDGEAYERMMQPEIGKIKAPHKPFSSRAFITQACLANAAHVLNRWPPAPHDRVAIVFEQEKGMGQAVDYFTFCKKRRERWTRWFLTFTTAPKEFVPVQIADFLAYEAWKLAVNRAKRVEKPHSPTLERMLAGGTILMKEMTEEHLKASVPRMQAFVQDHPDGLFAARKRR